MGRITDCDVQLLPENFFRACHFKELVRSYPSVVMEGAEPSFYHFRCSFPGLPYFPAQKYSDIRIMKYQSLVSGTMSLYLALCGAGQGVYQFFGV
jgi:hypothetical protein